MTLNRFEMHLLASRVAYKRIANKIESAIAILQQFLAQSNSPYLAFSGGKDSGVLLDIALRMTHLPVIWLVNYPLPGQLHHLSIVEQRYHISIKRVWVNQWANSEFGAYYGQDLHIPSGIRIDEIHPTMAAFIETYHWDGLLMGMRSEESTKRRYILHDNPVYFVQTDGLWHGSPLHNWTLSDVWAYIAHHRLPIHPAYPQMINTGIPIAQCRVDGMDNVRIIEYGLHEQFKRLWPDEWQAFVELNPCVRNV